ncbi:MAG: tRNA guanosine transglycosylase [Phycisphaerales bacterium]
MSALRFEIEARSASCAARVGRVRTLHGEFVTPAFMPVGTKGSVKGIPPWMVASTGAEVVLANTYHLLLRPGPESVSRRGGLHAFTGWPASMLTDSGGYQVYSLADISKITEEGVAFRSVIDGAVVKMSPESATRTQNLLGADIIMAFDDCPPSVDPKSVNQTRRRMGGTAEGEGGSKRTQVDHEKRVGEACERTIRWLKRCVEAHERADAQSLFGIVQGGTDLERRSWCAREVRAFDLPGYAIGGVAVGEGHEEIVRVVNHTAGLLPEERPRYLMGVGYERDILAAVRAGVDMFDCVLPTRNGRNANAFTRTGQLRLRNAACAEDDGPIEEGCDCPACAPVGAWGDLQVGGASPKGWFSRAYLRHLFLSGEMLGGILVSLHNLRHFQRLLLDIRTAIRDDGWSALARRWPVLEQAGGDTSADGAQD